MQMLLPLSGLDAPPALGWEGLDPDRRAEAVAVLARVMVKVPNPEPQHEEHNDEQS